MGLKMISVMFGNKFESKNYAPELTNIMFYSCQANYF